MRWLKELFKNHFATWLLLPYLLTAMFADGLANDKPIFCVSNEGVYWLAFTDTWRTFFSNASHLSESVDWKHKQYDLVIWPIIPFSPKETHLMESALLSPFSATAKEQGHWLGTDALGRDVLSGIIHGSRWSLSVAILGMVGATSVGLMFGLFAGWWRDKGLKMKRLQFYALIFSIFWLAIQVYLAQGSYTIPFWVMGLGMLGLLYLLSSIMLPILSIWFRNPVTLPLNASLDYLLVMISSFPIILLILTLSQSLEPGLSLLILSISLLGWPLVALLTRSETERMRQTEFILAGQASGLPVYRLLLIHILPNLWPRIQVVFSLGVAQAVMLESALSYLGLGVPLDQVSWGSQIASAQSQRGAWWLVVFPGIALLLFVAVVMKLSRPSLTTLA